MKKDGAARFDFSRNSVRFVDAFRVKPMPKTMSVARVAVMRQMRLCEPGSSLRHPFAIVASSRATHMEILWSCPQ